MWSRNLITLNDKEVYIFCKVTLVTYYPIWILLPVRICLRYPIFYVELLLSSIIVVLNFDI